MQNSVFELGAGEVGEDKCSAQNWNMYLRNVPGVITARGNFFSAGVWGSVLKV